MGRFNLLINSVGKPNNVSQAIVELLAGLQALGGPRSALVQIIHAHFAKVTTSMLYPGSRFNMSVTTFSFPYYPLHTSTRITLLFPLRGGNEKSSALSLQIGYSTQYCGLPFPLNTLWPLPTSSHVIKL